MLKKAIFTRKKEDFDCEVCGKHVSGNGYTNHCPMCLCSKHVDINPGDRCSTCQGIMQPVAFELRHGVEYLIHRCTKCGHTRSNKVSKEDNRSAVRAVASNTWAEYLDKLKAGK